MKKNRSRKKKVVSENKQSQVRAILFIVLLAALLGGVTQLFRFSAVMADTVEGISYTSSIPSNTDASREGRSYQANVSYT